MHIKRIILEGFKTYKDRTEIPELSSQVNAVLGKNGSGKSNLLDAIAFVLSDKYSRGQEDSKSVLYAGAGLSSSSSSSSSSTRESIIAASVEIVFDNSDSRLPVDRDEVRIKRTVGAKKDEYFLDNVNKSAQEIIQTLEAAGLSRSNPYNIVQQGKIAELIRMSNQKRLALLKDIAGTQTYDDRRVQSLKIMKETDVRRADIEEVIDYLEQRLGELETEKTELKEYEALDSQRRSIEFTIYEKEREQAETKLKGIEASIESIRSSSASTHDALVKAEMDREDLESTLRNKERALKKNNQDKKTLHATRRDELNKEKKLEMNVKEVLELRNKEEEERDHAQSNLASLVDEIALEEQEKVRVTRGMERFLTEERDLKRQLSEAKSRLDSIYAKQSRTSQFATQAERDTYLAKQIASLLAIVKREEAQIQETTLAVSASQAQIKRLQDGIAQKEAELANLKERLEVNAASFDGIKSRRESINVERKNVQRELSELNARDGEDLDKHEQRVASTLDAETWRGIQNVWKIIAQHPQEYPPTVVHGLVLELFTTRVEFHRALETVLGTSLFHFVVANESVAASLIKRLAAIPRGGRVTFMPLNRVTQQHFAATRRQAALPVTADAVVLSERLDAIEPQFVPLMQSLLGRVLLCRTLEVAAAMTAQHQLTCVTLDGHKVDRKGAFTGGYVDAKRSRITAYRSYKSVKDKQEEAREMRTKLKARSTELDAALASVLNESHVAEEDSKQVRRQHETLLAEVRALQQEVEHESSVLSHHQSLLSKRRDAIALNQTEIQRCTAERSSPFSSALSAAEQRELEDTLHSMQELEVRVADVAGRRGDIEVQLARIQARLSENLLRRRSELTASISGLRLEEVKEEYSRLNDELQQAIVTGKDLDAQIAALDGAIESLLSEFKSLSTRVEQARETERRARESSGTSLNELERLLTFKFKHTSKIDEALRKARDLGAVSLDATDATLKAKSIKTLLHLAESINHKLLSFQHVNKKALDQYISFLEQRQDLLTRAAELDAARTSINDLIAHLDAKKDEAIQRTFKQIGQNFAAVFKELVPGGEGQLIIETSKPGEEEYEDETESQRDERKRREREELALQKSRRDAAAAIKGRRASRGSKRKRGGDVEEKGEEKEVEEDAALNALASRTYTGVAIKVRFPGATSETHQLSGGQESVVALSLIFAIQRCDPSPFYVFDEIDSALDPTHRSAVAEMIDKQRNQAQFIVTSFSRELIANADQYYGVVFQNKTSKVRQLDEMQALELVEIQEKEQADVDEH